MLSTGFQKPKRLSVSSEDASPNYGQFVAQPFERGFGTTIGNAMRRVLLASIEGAAITAVKIEGILHEFSPITGIVEDATDLILNLKQISFKINGLGPKLLRLESNLAGILTAGDIKTDGDVEILDEKIYIATVSDGGQLEMEMRLANGRSYVSADKNFTDDLAIGYIPIDSVHSPVRKVNYSIESSRLGQTTDYEKLTIDVWTNGSITPEDAIGHAGKLLKDHMSIFINFEEQEEVEEEVEAQEENVTNENLSKSVDELELSVRSYNCLKNANIKTIEELVQKTESEMLKTKNFGRKSLNEIKEILTTMGLGLGWILDEDGRPVEGLVENE